jgi:hypothetical protein
MSRTSFLSISHRRLPQRFRCAPPLGTLRGTPSTGPQKQNKGCGPLLSTGLRPWLEHSNRAYGTQCVVYSAVTGARNFWRTPIIGNAGNLLFGLPTARFFASLRMTTFVAMNFAITGANERHYDNARRPRPAANCGQKMAGPLPSPVKSSQPANGCCLFVTFGCFCPICVICEICGLPLLFGTGKSQSPGRANCPKNATTDFALVSPYFSFRK